MSRQRYHKESHISMYLQSKIDALAIMLNCLSMHSLLLIWNQSLSQHSRFICIYIFRHYRTLCLIINQQMTITTSLQGTIRSIAYSCFKKTFFKDFFSIVVAFFSFKINGKRTKSKKRFFFLRLCGFQFVRISLIFLITMKFHNSRLLFFQ